MFKPKTYLNTTELAQLNGVPLYLSDFVDACLRGRLNLFLQGDTGSGKTQLARDAIGVFDAGIGDGKYAQQIQKVYQDSLTPKTNFAIDTTKNFPADKTLFVLGRNDMDTRELFKRLNLGKLYAKPSYSLEPLVNPDTGEIEWYYPQINDSGIIVPQKLTKEQAEKVKNSLEKVVGTTENITELTSKINTNLIVVDELPNCVPAVRAQLFNLFDGFIELDGKAYPLGSNYSVGIATGNIGQQFTESSNELGRALKDRMHLILDVDYFTPQPIDTFDILTGNANPRVNFSTEGEDLSDKILKSYQELSAQEIPFEKYLIVNYLIHGLDYLSDGRSKRKLKSGWPNKVEGHAAGSDEALILPVSVRAAKAILALSQALDQITQEKGAKELGYFASMMTAFKFASAYSGILNEALVKQTYDEDHYAAMDAVIALTLAQFDQMKDPLGAGLEMVIQKKKNKKVVDLFTGRWSFMKNLLENLAERQ